MNDRDVRAAIDTAIEHVLAERPQLDFGAHERSTAFRLAVHMEPLFPGWNVDCEYDRDGDDLGKHLAGIRECSDKKRTDAIIPDIIVHHRRQQGHDHNLLVIELKKNSECDPCDQRKLELLTSPDGHFHYQLGLYINIAGGQFARTWYENGRQQDNPTPVGR